MKRLVFLLFVFSVTRSFAQFEENFSDGDFSNNPVWQGDTSSFLLESNVLKSNNLIANSQYYLSTSSSLVRNSEWKLLANLAFNTSSLNYVDFFLVSDNSDLKTGTKNGYFVRIGGAKDEICLHKKQNGVNTLLIDGLDGTTNKSSNTIAIKVSCSGQFQWNLERNLSGLATNFTSEGVISDSSVLSSQYSGVLVAQSTSSFFQKHTFSEISARLIQKDTVAPVLSTKNLVGSLNPMSISFDEAVDTVWLHTNGSLSVSDIYGNELVVEDIIKDTALPNTYQLYFRELDYLEGQYLLLAFGVKDVNGNVSKMSQSAKIHFQRSHVARYKQIVFTELMIDPVPSDGLPEKEFVEIFNNSDFVFDLKNYVLADPSVSVKIPSYLLQPNEYLILCKAADSADFKQFGHVLYLSTMPSLNNSSDNITLKNADGELIDKVSYFLSWYKDSQKDDGGYSLELIDPKNICLEGENWKASNSSTGGTPGQKNSVFEVLKDSIQPKIQSLKVVSNFKLEIAFSEKIDSAAFVESNFLLNGLSGVDSILWNPDSLNRMSIKLGSELTSGVENVLLVKKIMDCSGNESSNLSITFVLPDKPSIGDVLINEVLFNPLPYGADFVELYNTSGKFIDLQGWKLANVKNDTVSNEKIMFNYSLVLGPNEYLVLTEDKNSILNNYTKSRADRIFEVTTVPTYYDDLGSVVLLDNSDVVMDRFDYEQNMHSVLVSKKEGVSLEKINPTLETNKASNWTSASKESGYATPGYANSQFVSLAISEDELLIEPQLITPNGDGDKDFMVFRIQSNMIATIRNIVIFDVMGREVKHLLKNGFSGSQTLVQWDGTDDSFNVLPIGHYIVWFEMIDNLGNILHSKRKVVVGNRL